MKDLIKWGLIAGAAWVGWNIFTSSQATAAAPAVPPSPATPAPPATTTAVPPATTTVAPPATITAAPPPPPPPAPAATAVIVGAVTPNVNNSLTANVSVNGGAAQNLTIIQSSAQAYNTAGKNITATLKAQGVNVPALLALMQATYKGLSGVGASYVLRNTPIAPRRQQNYVRTGAPMR